MTEDEKRLVSSHGFVAGALGVPYFGIPASLGVSFLIRFPVDWRAGGQDLVVLGLVLLASWIILGSFALFHHRKLGKELLCATQWAKSQGITSDTI
jgi:hypothetical protein